LFKACPNQATKLPKRPQIVAEAIVAENGNTVARNGNSLLPFSARNGNNLLPFSATLLPGVDRPFL